MVLNSWRRLQMYIERKQSAVAVYELVRVGAIQKFPLAVHPFDSIRSKIFFSRSAVRPYPFENFLHPFSRSTSSVRKFSSSVQLFDLIRSKIFFIHSAVRPHPFENFLHPFSRSLYPFRTACLPVSHPFACRAFGHSNGYR